MKRLIPLLLAVASCQEPTTPTLVNGLPPDIAQAVIGTWSLVSWNGKPMPAKYETHYRQELSNCPPPNEHLKECWPPIFVEDYVVSFESSEITLNDDGKFTRTVTMRTDYADQSPTTRTTETVNGTYSGSVAGGTVTLSLSGPIVMTGPITSTSFTARLGVAGSITFTDVWLYQK
jgi:hypothetical protein